MSRIPSRNPPEAVERRPKAMGVPPCMCTGGVTSQRIADVSTVEVVELRCVNCSKALGARIGRSQSDERKENDE